RRQRRAKIVEERGRDFRASLRRAPPGRTFSRDWCQSHGLRIWTPLECDDVVRAGSYDLGQSVRLQKSAATPRRRAPQALRTDVIFHGPFLSRWACAVSRGTLPRKAARSITKLGKKMF